MIKEHVTVPGHDRDGWFVSSYSGASGGACVEVKFAVDTTLVRDSKDVRADRPVIGLSSTGWNSFLNTVTGSW
ncbi:DUF397 domain-containing protein [Actinophytocola sp.]|uniref:DUF397 domain-containing protein n=1 Tax=Actinophytocola sp. TaxID=1872138 RepID=UPI0025C3A86D|nr:DUF397 domain-containing protein [Actinophytocola sp.]